MTPKRWLVLLLLMSVLIGLAGAVTGGGQDYRMFIVAAKTLLQGQSPYTIEGYYNPIYVAIAFIPFSLLPDAIGYPLFAGASFFVLGLTFYKLTRNPIITALLLATASALHIIWYGNIDAWVIAAAVVNPIAGVFMGLAKPQIGAVLGLFCLIRVWDRSRRGALFCALLVTVFYALSFSAGLWRTTPIDRAWNFSAWPIGLLIGIPVLILAWRDKSRRLALGGMPLISPYLGGPDGYTGVLVAFARSTWAAIGCLIVSWILLLIWRYRL